MNAENIAIREKLKKKLPPARFEHTLGVCYMSVALAMRWGADIHKAELAGLLHDCAKQWKSSEIVAVCDEKGVRLREEERRTPSVVHQTLGAWMAEHTYGVKDQEVLSAIACHTTGRPGMSTLDKIVYLADFIEPDRKMLDCMDAIRREAFVDLDGAVLMELENVLGYLRSTGAPVDSKTRETYEDFLRLREERRNHG
ncbi:bis(5'-nucleosyl)-tetraphosphatase (symmetrical) YqeK [Clostridium vitabionis]|uniref:bis(5'-nucleosyl)-tetraphosphatase (symmetrical) YqeK n=1 Tax=Clostridium vitabionis TaxID=2784388 RepID=UPI00188B1581|nr:bis(5'-nucleosyl)-tetraphosphatase (symmetrical) YqeK [Clostridium vitabionis]